LKYLKTINFKNKFTLATGAGKELGRACSMALVESMITKTSLLVDGDWTDQ